MKLEFDKVSFHYTDLTKQSSKVLNNISLAIHENECLAIVGPSGSGKTTLLQHFTGLLTPCKGRVLCDGSDIASKGVNLTQLRRRIGLVFQFPENQLFEETVFKDVAFGPLKMGLDHSKLAQRVRSALETVGLDFDRLENRSPFTLSEGEKRRTAIAGILAMDPEMIAFDEPTAGLDPKSVSLLKDMSKGLLRQGKTVVVVTHHMDFVASIADRVVVMWQGKIIFDDTPVRLFRDRELLNRAGLDVPDFQRELEAWRGKLPEILINARDRKEWVEKLTQITHL
ncbi:ATP-binding cassette domain-containing protein [candidate division KSB1 bacterium]|nr:ATP-binding cassette domain-containing protein [candidate division KSB1 bacterium]